MADRRSTAPHIDVRVPIGATLVGTRVHGPAAAPADEATKPAPDKPRPPLSALWTLKPYILRQRHMLAWAALAMVGSAAAMLLLPIAVRRMIDQGFSGSDSAIINSSFLFLIALGASIAVASSARFYCVNCWESGWLPTCARTSLSIW